MLSTHFLIYASVMSIFPLGVFTVLMFQILGDKYGKHKINDKVQRILLYSVYISALICSCFGYSLHVSRDHPRWCDVFGLPPCFAMLGATKAFLYAFFLRRARKANAYNINGNTCALYLFDYIGPIYIFIYWLCYCTFAGLFFTGKVTDADDEHVISYCSFQSWRWWFVIFSNTVDIFNCVATLILFMLPLLHSIKRLRINNDNVNHRLLHTFIRTMRWNVALSFTATVSSVSTLIVIPFVKEYIWLFCSGDPFVNSVCVYLMMATNRTFIKRSCFRTCDANSASDKDRSITSQSPNSAEMHSQSKNDVMAPHHATHVSYNMDEFIANTLTSVQGLSALSSVSPEVVDSNETIMRVPSRPVPPLNNTMSHSSALHYKVPDLAMHALHHSY